MSVGVDDGTGTVDSKRKVEEALASLPRQLRDVISNVVILADEEPRPGQPLLGLYQGIPLTRRGPAMPASSRTRSRSTGGRSSV